MMSPTIASLPPSTPPKGPPSPPPEEAGREEQHQQPQVTPLTQTAMDAHLHPRSVATLSQAWEYNDLQTNCYRCSIRFTLLERKHHCRYCGKIFCHSCSNTKCLIPPSAIVLVPKGGKHITSREAEEHSTVSFSPDEDPDRMLTYVAQGGANGNENGEVLLYGKGLEERFQLAREPLRVCRECCLSLQPLQAELQRSNSHSMRFNHIDPTDARRLFNSPLAFTLGHEVRKAAYTLNNLLPQPKRRLGATMDFSSAGRNEFNYTGTPGIHQQCQDECQTLTPTMAQLDGVRIPAKLLEQAKGIAVLTVAKGGFGLAGFEFGTGLVVARLGNSNTWSAPSAIGTAGLSWGALLGAQVSDHVFVCMTEEAVEMLMSSNGSVQLGADIGVAVGPVGRSLEADYGASHGGHVAPIYTYSLSKGFYAGVSLDGKVIVTRHNVNEKFYGRKVAPEEILQGRIPTPPAAQPLYDALTRCQVYVQPNFHANRRSMASSAAYPSIPVAPQPQQLLQQEYGEWQPGTSNFMDGMNNMTLGASNNSMSSPYNMTPNTGSFVSPVPVMGQQQPTMMQKQQQQPVAMQQPQPPQPSAPMPQQPPPPPPQQQPQPTIVKLPPLPGMNEEEEILFPPAANDQHSYAGLSDITSDPGY